jgi:Protein of unknown function, DUF485
MSSQNASDLTPESEAPTDIAPLGRSDPKPAHELTAEEDTDVADWDCLAAKFMEQRIIGDVNVAYLFALSQFFMAWILAFLYVAAAAGWDRQAAALIAKSKKGSVRTVRG